MGSTLPSVLMLRGLAGLLYLFVHVLQGCAGFCQRLLGVVGTVAQPLELFLPHVQLCVQQRTLLCRAHLCLLMLQECRLELGLQMDIVLLCCGRTLGGLFSEGVSPCDVCGHGGALFLECCQRLRGFYMVRLPLLGVRLDRLHLLLDSVEGFLCLANGLTELPEFLDLHRRLRRFDLTDGLIPFRQLGLQRGLLVLSLLDEQAQGGAFLRALGYLAAQLLLECLACGDGLLQLRLRLCQSLHGGRVALLPLLCLGLRGVLLLPQLLLRVPGLGELLLRLGQRLLVYRA